MPCPVCDSIDINTCYTCPPTYNCRTCRTELLDSDDTTTSVINPTIEEARAKRPGLFGMPVCSNCNHTPHDGACRQDCSWCRAEFTAYRAPRLIVKPTPAE